jgi:hypothetical protein
LLIVYALRGKRNKKEKGNLSKYYKKKFEKFQLITVLISFGLAKSIAPLLSLSPSSCY